jgi:hypothetical protein
MGPFQPTRMRWFLFYVWHVLHCQPWRARHFFLFFSRFHTNTTRRILLAHIGLFTMGRHSSMEMASSAWIPWISEHVETAGFLYWDENHSRAD